MAQQPSIQAAALCEKVLKEQDGVLSAIRIVDTFGVAIPENVPPNVKPAVEMELLVSLKSSEISGGTLTVIVHGPSKANDPQHIPVTFAVDSTSLGTADEQKHTSGASLIMKLVIGVERLGNCRIELLWDGEPFTTIPFRLVQVQAQPAAPPELPQ